MCSWMKKVFHFFFFLIWEWGEKRQREGKKRGRKRRKGLSFAGSFSNAHKSWSWAGARPGGWDPEAGLLRGWHQYSYSKACCLPEASVDRKLELDAEAKAPWCGCRCPTQNLNCLGHILPQCLKLTSVHSHPLLADSAFLRSRFLLLKCRKSWGRGTQVRHLAGALWSQP